ncbi:MAG: O-antigen ligase family protein [Proteobacteria bacterium]|nr:O-antigen ligase family protein [Pseudomonadota bacterium]
MTSFETLVLLAIFSALAIGLTFFKRSVALICMIISGHIDLGVGAIGGVESLSVFNSIKVLGFPAWMMLRMRRYFFAESILNVPSLLWAAFIGYAALSLLWTPPQFVGAGIKQVGYFLAYTLGFIAFHSGWRSGDLRVKNVIIAIFVSLLLALLQTYVLGNHFGKTLSYDRFVSFTSKQQFGEFLFACTVLMLFVPNVGKMYRILLLLFGLWIPLFLNGSRVGALSVFMATTIFLLTREWTKAILALLLILSLGMVTFIAKDSLLEVASIMGKNNRLFEFVNKPRINGEVEQVGTLKARLVLWENTLTRIQTWSTMQIFFGRGISSSGMMVKEKGFSRIMGKIVSADPNRTMHNEFLRVVVEYGLLGFFIFIAFLASLMFWPWVRQVPSDAKLMLMAFMPGFLLYLLSENIFSASGSAGGIGSLVVLSYVFAAKSG